jgi:hypothetical protein
MRAGLTVSLLGHAALIAWGILVLPATKPLDASDIEAVPIEMVDLADETALKKGVRMAALVQEEQPVAPVRSVDEPPPLPRPPPAVASAPPPPPPVVKPVEPEPTPPPVAAAEPDPTPPPAPAPEPASPPPEPVAEAPPPPEEPTPPAVTPPRPHLAPAQPTPKVAAQTPKPKEQKPFDIDQITAMLDKQPEAAPQPDPAPAQPQPAKPQTTIGSLIGETDVAMTANELDALRARLAQCWSPPIGWTDPAEVRVVLMLYLNSDGSMSQEPQVVEAPAGRYSQTAPESAVRAVRRCAPYNLPPEKFESWKQVKVTFDPINMSGVL